MRIFFPDPWPKARHHKRRILQSGPLHLIADRLAEGGVLHVATDHAGYAEWIDELVDVLPELHRAIEVLGRSVGPLSDLANRIPGRRKPIAG